ncbi:MAG: hypothetical protein GX676_04105 [Bacilli bacterium]|nr:hypothetical protein [Bacilli bacterium]
MWLKISGLQAIIGTIPEGSLDAKYQLCTVHFYRNIFSVIPRTRVKYISKMLKAIHV